MGRPPIPCAKERDTGGSSSPSPLPPAASTGTDARGVAIHDTIRRAAIHDAHEQTLFIANSGSSPLQRWRNSSSRVLGSCWPATPATTTKRARKTVSGPAALTPSVSTAAGQSVALLGTPPRHALRKLMYADDTTEGINRVRPRSCSVCIKRSAFATFSLGSAHRRSLGSSTQAGENGSGSASHTSFMRPGWEPLASLKERTIIRLSAASKRGLLLSARTTAGAASGSGFSPTNSFTIPFL